MWHVEACFYANTQSRVLCVKCPVDGELSSERKSVLLCGAKLASRCFIMKKKEISLLSCSQTCFYTGVFALSLIIEGFFMDTIALRIPKSLLFGCKKEDFLCLKNRSAPPIGWFSWQ